MIAGFLINKFRGDIRLFDDGLTITEQRSGWRSFGVVPFLPIVAKLPAEDHLVKTLGFGSSRRCTHGIFD
jgi:adenosylcobyric acid synthase